MSDGNQELLDLVLLTIYFNGEVFWILNETGESSAEQDRSGMVQILRELEPCDAGGRNWEPEQVLDFAEADLLVEIFIDSKKESLLKEWVS